MAKIESTCGHIKIMLIIEMAKIKINRRPYWIYANCRDGQNRINRPYWKYPNYRDFRLKLTGGHIRIMLIIEIVKVELTGRHTGFMLIIEIVQIK